MLNEANQAAIKAVNAYESIVNSINESMEAAKDALNMSMKAIQQVRLGAGSHYFTWAVLYLLFMVTVVLLLSICTDSLALELHCTVLHIP